MAERFCDVLRTARVARGLDVKDVARATRISLRVLEAIERGDLSALPPPAYSRAFLRDYATYLGLDPGLIIGLYEEESPSHAAPSPRYAPPVAPLSDAPEPTPRAVPMKPPRVKRVDTNMTAVIAVAIVAITGFVLVYFFLAGDSNDKKVQQVTSQAPPPPIVPQNTSPVAEQPQADTGTIIPSPTYSADSLTLEALASDSVWVNVVADTSHVQRGLIRKGARASWRAKTRFVLTVGNSKLVTFTLNGARLSVNDSAGSSVLRNVLITAHTSVLTPGSNSLSARPAPVVGTQQTPIKKSVPVKQPPRKQAPSKPVKPPTPTPSKNTGAAGNKKAPAAPPQKTPSTPKRPKWRQLPDEIKKVPIR